MLTEDSVPPKDRVLTLAARLTEHRFSQERFGATAWCEENQGRLSESNLAALERLRKVELSENVVAFVVYRCYADIPKDRSYTALFDCSHSSQRQATVALLRVGIFMRQVPIEGLEHGHHQVAVFEFPNGTPPLLKELPLCDEPQVTTKVRLGLCDIDNWEEVRANKSDA
jgi:hypothetical protein